MTTNPFTGYKPYADLTELNTHKDLLDTVGKATLERIARSYLDLLETSAAIYEVDGSYATALFSSGYCKLLDSASRELCNTSDNAEALICGKWLCHESCWTNASRITIETGVPYDLRPCNGGLKIYAVPIKAFGRIVGSINCGYGCPPSDDKTIRTLSDKYNVDKAKLTEMAQEYKERPQFIVEAVKRNVLLSAELIGDIYERNKLASELSEKEEQLHAAFEFSTIGISITSPEKGLVSVNEKFCNIMGYTRQELTHLTWAEITQPDDLESSVTLFNRVLAGEIDGYTLDKRFIRKNGSVIYTTLWVNCKRRDNGTIDYFIALIQDITKRKKIEEEREQFHKFFNSSDDLMVIADPNGAFKSINPACMKVLGYSEQELLSRPFIDFVHPDDRQSTLDEMARQIQRGYSLDFENRYVCKNGSFRYLSWHASYIASEGITYATARDVTDFKMLEADLIKTNTDRVRAEEQNKTIISTSIDGFLKLNVSGRLLYANEAYCNMSGYTQEELLQMEVQDIEASESPEETKSSIIKVMETGGDRFETRHRRKDGRIIDVEISVNYIRKDDLLFAFIRDITARKRMENEIKAINLNLQKRVEEEVARNRVNDQLMYEQSRYLSMGELLMNISHHWRQPLCGVALSIQDIKDAYLHNELDEKYLVRNIKLAMSELKALSGTIDTFRNFYVYDKEQNEFNIAAEINRAATLISGAVKKNNIVIDKDLDETLTVRGYPNDFAHAILNILTNAIDNFGKNDVAGAIIKIRLFKEASKNMITILDNGGGIPDDIINKVFDPYFTTKDRSSGTGMGLYTAKVTIEKKMAGTISATNIDGWCELRIEL